LVNFLEENKQMKINIGIVAIDYDYSLSVIAKQTLYDMFVGTCTEAVHKILFK